MGKRRNSFSDDADEDVMFKNAFSESTDSRQTNGSWCPACHDRRGNPDDPRNCCVGCGTPNHPERKNEMAGEDCLILNGHRELLAKGKKDPKLYQEFPHCPDCGQRVF